MGKSPLNAFDSALLDAKVGDLNLLKTSSIVPPGAEVIALREHPEALALPAGSIVPAVYTCFVDDAAGEVISACLAVGLPSCESTGVIFEYCGRGHLSEIRPLVRSMAAEALKSRGKSSFQVLYAESELTVPDRSYGCVVALAILLDPSAGQDNGT